MGNEEKKKKEECVHIMPSIGDVVRTHKKLARIRRERKCRKCGEKFVTIEKTEESWKNETLEYLDQMTYWKDQAEEYYGIIERAENAIKMLVECYEEGSKVVTTFI